MLCTDTAVSPTHQAQLSIMIIIQPPHREGGIKHCHCTVVRISVAYVGLPNQFHTTSWKTYRKFCSRLAKKKCQRIPNKMSLMSKTVLKSCTVLYCPETSMARKCQHCLKHWLDGHRVFISQSVPYCMSLRSVLCCLFYICSLGVCILDILYLKAKGPKRPLTMQYTYKIIQTIHTKYNQ